MLKRRVLYAAMAACAVSCSAHAAPPMTDAEWTAYEESHTRFIFQQFGADPETARWAAWAMKYQPSSRCAMSARPVFHAVEGGMSLFPGEGEGMVVDHICEPEALKHDALTIPPFSAIEGKNERLQWKITQRDIDKARQEEDEHHKEIIANTQVVTHKCQFDYVEYPEEAQELGNEGSVRATCHFQKDKDNYWHADSCNFSYRKGTDDSFLNEAKRYMTSACWSSDNFPVSLDHNGTGARTIDFSLGGK